jgi:hypothetical protein
MQDDFSIELFNADLENNQKKMIFVVKNLQDKLKKCNKKIIQLDQNVKFNESKFNLSMKLLEYILLNFFKFDYKEIQQIHLQNSLQIFEMNLKSIFVLIEKALFEIQKEIAQNKENTCSQKKESFQINFLINAYIKKNIIFKNEIENLKKDQKIKNEVLDKISDFLLEKEQIKSSFMRFFEFLKEKKFRELQIVCKVILDVLEVDVQAKNQILEILVNLL